MEGGSGYGLLCLRDALRSGDIHVPGSRRYADPTAYLITAEAWPAQRAEFCALVDVEFDPVAALAGVDTELHTALGELEQLLAGGTGPVRLGGVPVRSWTSFDGSLTSAGRS